MVKLQEAFEQDYKDYQSRLNNMGNFMKKEEDFEMIGDEMRAAVGP